MPKKKSTKVAAAVVATPKKTKTRKIPEGCTIIELRSRREGMPIETNATDVANQLCLAVYGRPLSECLGQAQGDVRVRDNEKNYIVVYLPVTASSSEKITPKSRRKYEQAVIYIHNIVGHAINRGIKIRIEEI